MLLYVQLESVNPDTIFLTNLSSDTLLPVTDLAVYMYIYIYIYIYITVNLYNQVICKLPEIFK